MQAVAIQTAGTKVTLESFENWKVGFEAELVMKRKQEEQERLKALPPKEREETKRYLAKLSGAPLAPFSLAVWVADERLAGRQLFEKDSALFASDAAFDEEGAEAVDVSLYERVEGLSEDEEEETKLGDMSDSD